MKSYEELCNPDEELINLLQHADMEVYCLESLKISEPYEEIYAQILLRLESICTND